MTFQVRETLVHRGRPRPIRALPLAHFERPFPALRSGGISSRCWRGYEGTWEVRGDALHLARLTGPCLPFPESGDESPDELATVFPGRPGPVEATWFSGLIVPDDTADPDLYPPGTQHTFSGRPPEYLWFALVVHRGKVLLEEEIDARHGAARGRMTGHAEALFPGDEAAFLRAIQARPGDLTPRLVYADWLEELSDPRGPLLRSRVRQLAAEGPRRPWTERSYRQDIPTGYVSPEDVGWFWRWLAGIPEPAREDWE